MYTERGAVKMSLGAWTWHKNTPEPVQPMKEWTAGTRVRYKGMDDRFDGTIRGVFRNYLLILTDYGYRTCVNIYDAEKYMEELE